MSTADSFVLDRVLRWTRRHVLIVDAAWATLWCLLSIAFLFDNWLTDAQVGWWLAIVAANWVGLTLRRSLPRVAIGILAAAMVVHVLALHTVTLAAAVATFTAAHTAHASLGRRDRTIVTAALGLGTAWAAFDYTRDFVDLDWPLRWPVVVIQWILVAFFCLLGAMARKRREELEQAVEHARMLERQQAQEIRMATLDERAHIAREMHDIVAHSLGVIIAQADGGRYAGAADPDAGQQALATIAQVGRHSLAEMRQLLTVLRTDDTRDVLPAPGLDDLDALATDYRKAGLDVRLNVTGDPRAVSETVGLTAYRIVQEALTNVLKHAGPTRVRVELNWGPQVLGIDIRSPLRATEDAPAPVTAGPGHGLVGMRERVAAHGGTVTAGPDGSVWRVHAEIPIAPGAPK